MIKVAVVGCGYWGPNLVRNLNQVSGCRMYLCCDHDRDRLKRMKRLYPMVKQTDNFQDLVNDPKIDAVCIATPVYTHFEMARECLLRNKHVLVEKPLAASVKEGKELIALARKKRKILMVGHTFVYTAAVNKAREIIRSGELGKILYIFSSRVNLGIFQNDINVVWDLAPHDISIVLYLLEEDPISVSGQGQAHYKPDIEDVASITLSFSDNKMVFIHNSWLDPNKIRKTTVVGSKKMLVYDDVEPLEKIKIYDKGVEAPAHYDTFGEFHFTYRYGDIHSPRLDDAEPLKIECNHFIDCIREKKQPRSDGYSGLRVVKVLEAATQSLKNGGASIPL